MGIYWETTFVRLSFWSDLFSWSFFFLPCFTLTLLVIIQANSASFLLRRILRYMLRSTSKFFFLFFSSVSGFGDLFLFSGSESPAEISFLTGSFVKRENVLL